MARKYINALSCTEIHKCIKFHQQLSLIYIFLNTSVAKESVLLFPRINFAEHSRIISDHGITGTALCVSSNVMVYNVIIISKMLRYLYFKSCLPVLFDVDLPKLLRKFK